MSGFGIVGCNPSLTGDTLEEIGGAALGQMGVGPAGLYTCVRAGNAIAANKLAAIEGGWRARQRDDADASPGARLGAATVAIANNDYGWVQVWGEAELTAGGTITASATLALDATETGDVVASTANTSKVTGLHAIDAIADNAVGTCMLMFPGLNVTT